MDIANEQAAHALLYVRDACGLTPADDPMVPPTLADQVPDRSSMLAGGDPLEAASDWLDWWKELVRFEGSLYWSRLDGLETAIREAADAVRTDAGVPLVDEIGEQIAGAPAVSDGPRARTARPTTVPASSPASPASPASVPPGAGSTDDSPGGEPEQLSLQIVASNMAGEALSWASRSRPDHERLRAHASWELGRTLAEEIIEAYQVVPERVRAGITVLSVDGLWGHVPEPGVLLCSEMAFTDEATFTPLLRQAFETSLSRSGP